MYEKRNSVYCYKGTDILVNKVDIKNKDLLKEYERQIVAIKLLELEKQSIDNSFDIKHFSNIHKFLFEDIYEFAGCFRNEDIAKANFKFARWEYIEDELIKLLEQLKNENYLNGLDKMSLANKLAYYMAELNVLHPFREGNGRTIREFIRQLAKHNGYYLNFNLVSAEEMLLASVKSVVDIVELEDKIYKCLQ